MQSLAKSSWGGHCLGVDWEFARDWKSDLEVSWIPLKRETMENQHLGAHGMLWGVRKSYKREDCRSISDI